MQRSLQPRTMLRSTWAKASISAAEVKADTLRRTVPFDFIPCDVRIYHDRRRPSRLEVLRLR